MCHIFFGVLSQVMDSSSLGLNAWAFFFIKLRRDLDLKFPELFYFMPVYFWYSS